MDFEYFPFHADDKSRLTIGIVEETYPDYELWKLLKVLKLLEMDEEPLYRPFDTLSNGEQTRMQIEELVMRHNLTMLLVEHDRAFINKVATKQISLYNVW